jgi:hypothetical protein
VEEVRRVRGKTVSGRTSSGGRACMFRGYGPRTRDSSSQTKVDSCYGNATVMTRTRDRNPLIYLLSTDIILFDTIGKQDKWLLIGSLFLTRPDQRPRVGNIDMIFIVSFKQLS